MAAVNLTELGFFILLDIPAHFTTGLAGALFVLFHVFNVELSEVQGDVLRQELAAVAGVLNPAHENVGELDFQILERLFSCLAHSNQSVFEVLTVATSQHHCAARLINELRN